MVNERTDTELEGLVTRRLGGEIADARRVAVARDRVWSRMRLKLREQPRRRGTPRVWGAIAIVAAISVVLAAAWGSDYRVEVAQGRLPVLYREDVGRAEIVGPPVAGELLIQQRHVEGAPGLRTVAQIEVRIAGDALPADVEVRAREKGSQVTGVIGQTRGLAEVRPATGTTTTSYAAPLPPVAEGETRTYEVWLWIDTPHGTIESERLTVEIVGRPEGERARLR